MNESELLFNRLKIILATGIFLAVAGTICLSQEKTEKGVKLVRQDDKQKIDVYINGSFFTSYNYPSSLEKPFLFPVHAPNGSVITRGFPLEPRKGERVDHPHQIGLWFNHGNVNGLDFWNNSSAIPAEKKDTYGHILVQKIVRAESGKKSGILEVASDWKDNKENTILIENTRYIFTADKNDWIIDHIATLTASTGPVKNNR